MHASIARHLQPGKIIESDWHDNLHLIGPDNRCDCGPGIQILAQLELFAAHETVERRKQSGSLQVDFSLPDIGFCSIPLGPGTFHLRLIDHQGVRLFSTAGVQGLPFLASNPGKILVALQFQFGLGQTGLGQVDGKFIIHAFNGKQ